MKNKGFIAPVITPDNYVLGASSVPKVILRPNGDWTTDLPIKEQQNIGFETFNCTSF